MSQDLRYVILIFFRSYFEHILDVYVMFDIVMHSEKQEILVNFGKP